MGIIASIFGGGKVISEGFKLIDSMHTSKEEEIEAKSKAKTDLLTAYAPFKIAQRVIAFAFTFVFLACFVLVMGMTMFGEPTMAANGVRVFDPRIADVRAVIGEFWVGQIMMIIVAFYFGGGAFEGIQATKNIRKMAKK